MQVDRRNLFKLFVSGAVVSGLSPFAKAEAIEQAVPISMALRNGLRTHVLFNESGYVQARLVLRSNEITHNGVAHLFEHTSCTGAAGTFSADEVTNRRRDYIQDGNASTAPGILTWDATFLPQYLPHVIALLAATTLDQKFDADTVEAQARVVLQELYLDKYDPGKKTLQQFSRELFGKFHPFVKETTDEEIEQSKKSTARLIQELQAFAANVRLPANIDLFLVGTVEPTAVRVLVTEHIGRYAFAEGPLLQIPQVAVTRRYKALTAASRELEKPMSNIKIAWNTGVRVTDRDARVLLALSHYLNTVLFNELRDKDGDAYTPEVSYEPDSCSGIFQISTSTSNDPPKVEKKIFEIIQKMKSDINAKELRRLRDVLELKRRKDVTNNQALLNRMVDRVVDGASVDDLALEAVTREEMLAAADRYLPSYRHAYVHLALKGQ